ncbi:MAG: deoxyribonuclease V [bacterium]
MEAAHLQKELSALVIRRDDFDSIRTLAGVDLSLHPNGEEAFAGVIVYEYPSLKELTRVWAQAPLPFPYIPGLLSFREGPVLQKAFVKLKSLPDLIVFDGQGIAHPRRLGIASHMGLLLDRPSIGCGKSLLCGKYGELKFERGSTADLVHDGEKVGVALRTRDGVNPVFVSLGHRISLETSVEIILQCHSGYRIPLPTREADRFVAEVKKAALAAPISPA